MRVEKMYEKGYENECGVSNNEFGRFHGMYCECCDTLFTGRWRIPEIRFDYKLGNELKRDKDYKKEIDTLLGMKQCPYCGEKVVHVPWYNSDSKYTFSDDELRGLWFLLEFATYDNTAEWCDLPEGDYEEEGMVCRVFSDSKVRCHDLETACNFYFQEKFYKEAKERATKKIEEYFAFDQKPADKNVSVELIAGNYEKLKGYFQQILKTEENIYSLTKRLEELHLQYPKHKRNAQKAQLVQKTKVNKKILGLRNELETLEMPKKNEPTISVQKRTEPQKPDEPIYKNANFFNRKRVERENQELLEQYRLWMKEYEKNVEEYHRALENDKKAMEAAKIRAEEEYQAALEAYWRNKEALEAEIEAEEKKCAEALATLEKTPEELFLETVEKEITEAEKTLKETYRVRNELYSCNVIYGKYRDFVTVASMYEYLASGRCSKLEGADGAYNLYESELRANLIVAELAAVISSLEDIKSNQYAMYNAIQETNKELNFLNQSMDKMVADMAQIKDSAQQTAYNTAATAYYAKKNAELTDALGFMVALG